MNRNTRRITMLAEGRVGPTLVKLSAPAIAGTVGFVLAFTPGLVLTIRAYGKLREEEASPAGGSGARCTFRPGSR